MKFSNFIKKYEGTYNDYDGVYGVQCVDLIKLYVDKVLGVKPVSIGNAIEYWDKRYSSTYLKSNFRPYVNTLTFVPKRGDIAVFKSKSGNGHVSVCTGEGNVAYFYSYDQNYPNGKGEPMTLIKHNYKSVLGFLRPINQTNIDEALEKDDISFTTGKTYTLLYNMNVRKSANGSILKYSSLTDNAKKNAVKGSNAVLKSGTKVTCKGSKTVAGKVWVKIPSGWIAGYDLNSKKRYIK